MKLAGAITWKPSMKSSTEWIDRKGADFLPRRHWSTISVRGVSRCLFSLIIFSMLARSSARLSYSVTDASALMDDFRLCLIYFTTARSNCASSSGSTSRCRFPNSRVSCLMMASCSLSSAMSRFYCLLSRLSCCVIWCCRHISYLVSFTLSYNFCCFFSNFCF